MRLFGMAAAALLTLGGAAAQTAPPTTNDAAPQTSPSTQTAPSRRAQGRHGTTHHTSRLAPAANSKVEIIGYGDGNTKATMDKPLLPIASIGNSLGISSGTPIQVLLKQSVDSGRAHNGDTIDATLAQPLAGMPVGTPVKLTVVQASAAGALLSFGELSIQVISIGAHSVLSEIVSAQGEEGKKELPDSAPTRGTEAIFSAGQDIALPAA